MSKLANWSTPILIAITLQCSTGKQEENPLAALLPQTGDAGPWKPDDEPQFVEGEDLFSLINGGAEIYHEYGFQRAAVQSYIDDEDRSLNLEIYEMTEPAAAYGIFTFKRGDGGQVLGIGDEASLEDYYLNVWKGNFVITVIGFDTESETKEGLESLARWVSGKIDAAETKPQLVGLLPKEGVDPNSVKYMKGNLALFNAFELAKGNVFGVREGVMARVGEETVFLFRYENEDQAREWFDKAREHLSQEARFQDLTDGENGFSVAFRESDEQLAATTTSNYIFVVIGKQTDRMNQTLDSLRKQTAES
jgi:hypothetical protein